ncbi:MAG: NAD(P)-binding domain-containing protein [Bacteroidales bacterium]|nr:NAD(P)-binding domain-containing protein [Bacteroidales bacterium]
MENKKLGFIGGGRITRIILQAFRNKNLDFDSICVYDPDTEVSGKLKEDFPNVKIEGSNKIPAQQGMVFLAVHPPVIMDTLKEIGNVVREEAVIVSLAPKITIEKIMSLVHSRKIIRMIPNATSYINEGYNPVYFSESFNKKEKKQLKKLFRSLGKTIEVEENELEPYAIVSAMLPTYFWFQWKKMEDIAVKTGFSEKKSRQIIKSTLRRSLKLYFNTGLSPEEVIDLIPVKPIGDKEKEIETILESKLLGLHEKIRP